jgi:CheY-like chemotaxis protein
MENFVQPAGKMSADWVPTMKHHEDCGVAGARERPLAGQRVLIVEDEAVVAVLIEDILVDNGCHVVGLASRLSDAMAKAQSLSFDIAIVDMNLNGQQSLPVAELLAQLGAAFVLATGYGANSLARSFPGVPILQKPFRQNDLERAVREALNVV